MVHDMSLTQRHAVVYDLPVVFDMAAAMRGVEFPYAWDDDYRARVGLLLHPLVDRLLEEFPRVDERRVGLPHRFGYSVMQTSDAGQGNAIVKHDFERATCDTRALAGEPGEAIFVPASADAAEDDGWVLSLVHDPARGASDLLVLNAQDITGEPQAVVHLPVRASRWGSTATGSQTTNRPRPPSSSAARFRRESRP